MGAPLDDLTLLHHQDLARLADRAEAVRDHEGGAALHEPGQPLRISASDSELRLDVASSRIRMRGLGEDRPGDGHPLALPALQPHSRSPTTVS